MFRIVLLSLVTFLMILSSLWAVLALWFQAPGGGMGRYGLPVLWLLGLVALLYWLWLGGSWWQSLLVYIALFALLLVWWGTIEPSNQRDWADDLAHTTTGVVDGRQVRLDNVRNFHWRSQHDYDIGWESRVYDLSRLRSVDMVTSNWGLAAISHVLVSFGFSDGEHVAFSVEIRREKHEQFSELGGFFKQFELSIIAADERDIVRVRSNVRNEELELYRINLGPADARELFRSFVLQANQLAEHPRFYHTVTGNCTTIVYSMMKKIVDGLPLDHRLLLTGYLPAYVHEVGGMVPGLPLAELQRRGQITRQAQAADTAPDFSALIRQGVPGWE
ncbi:Lnb N-terminal periplasmic domain-containing protein [Halopseudomonas bauzanensis]|uniref:Lnb N-terminal periplasmic domain-containing protein n=1 Tax=Halopseudomonas bauzanensis TaxID=653930 RepID=UPI002556C927|nr:DUF4105 domain-containing protein [Halopseudomonas bauzanensis]